MPREDFSCCHRLRVRWAEVDMQKIVFNGHYLTYIDTAIADYWRAIGFDYPEGYVARYASDLFLRKATLEYLGSAGYDDELEVLCRASRLGRSSVTFVFEVWRGPAGLLVAAELVYVNARPDTKTAVPLPEDFRQRVLAFERTAPAQ